jgi:hypothetical protein
VNYNGELIAGGDFTYVGGVKVNCIARASGSNWQPLAGGMSGGKDTTRVKALAVYKGELIAGGDFTNAGGTPAKRIARWNGTTWAGLGDGFNGPVQALTLCKGELIAGGTFTTSGETVLNGVARWNGTAWAPLEGGVSGTWGPGVYALAVFGGDLYVGGLFIKAGDVTANHIARWDGLHWQAMATGMSGSGYPEIPVAAMTVFNGELTVGGLFTGAGGIVANNIAKWNGTEWSAETGETDSGPRQIHALAVYNGRLIAGGVFPVGGMMSANGIAQWDGLDWEIPGRGVSSGAAFAAIAYNGELVTGGSFLTAGGKASAFLARWAPVEPTASIRQWRSLRYHDGAIGSELAIALNAPATTGNTITTEPRQGGVQKIVIDLTGPDDGSLAVEGHVMAEEIGGTGFAYPAAMQTLTHNEGNSYTLVAEWPAGLPDERCLRIDLGANIACLKGDTDCLVRNLTGDVNGDGVVDSDDLALARASISRQVDADNAALDVNVDGSLNSSDALVIRAFQERSVMSP